MIRIPDSHPIMDQGRTRGKLVHCQPGDLIIWDSRTIHCNTPATAPDERTVDEPVELLRIVAYVCMAPVSFVPADQLEEFREKRRQMVENNCTLNHWSTELILSCKCFHSNMIHFVINPFSLFFIQRKRYSSWC